MNLLFTVFELVAIAISVLSIAFIAHDGETHWMEGVQISGARQSAWDAGDCGGTGERDDQRALDDRGIRRQ